MKKAELIGTGLNGFIQPRKGRSMLCPHTNAAKYP